jgi:hypothetical protein
MKIPAPAEISKSLSSVLVFLSALSLGFLAGCGSGSGSPPPGTPIPGQTTNVTLLLSSAANDVLSSFPIGIVSITVTNQASPDYQRLQRFQ